MRILPNQTQAKVDQNLGTEPIIIVRIDWLAGIEYYGDKSFPLEALDIQGKIIECAPINAQEKLTSLSEVSSVSVTLFDDDGSLKSKINTEVIEGLDCIVYQYFDGLAQADLAPLLVGRIISPVNWHEGERQLSFDVETFIEDNEVGYAPQEGDITNLHPDAVDVPWPLDFGTVIHVPCVRIRHAPNGRLRYGINQNFTSFIVEGGEEFTQDTSVQINVGGILYTGSFDGNLFTIVTKNDAWHTNISLQNRKFSDAHVQDASVCWIDSNDHIAGLYVKVTHPTYGTCINQCIWQAGKKCFFKKPFRSINNPFQDLILDSGSTIAETAAIPRSTWGGNFLIESILRQGVGVPEDVLTGFFLIVIAGEWRTPSGAEVRLRKNYDDMYVANLIPSVEILDVFGYRTIEGERRFEPIPSNYYVVNLSDSLDGQSPTTFEFAIALEDRLGEGWDGDVYVSLRSSQGSNTASTIRYLFTNYSNITPDTTTFDEAITDVAPYLSSFTIFDRPNVLGLVDKIAWQAALSLVIRDNQAFIRFLAIQHDADLGISETEVELKTLQLGFTETEEVWTKIIATWKTDYSGQEDSEKEYIYRNNESVFGLKEEEIDFFIYNVSSILKLFVDYWGYKKSNIWRRCIFNTFLEGIVLDTYDILELAVTKFSTNNVRALIERVSYDNEESAVTVEAELWSKASDVDGGNEPIEDVGYYLGDPANPIDPINNPTDPEDPGADREEVDYEIPGDNQTNPDESPDDDTEETAENPKLYLSFVSEPVEVERGVNFPLQVVIRDSTGNLVSKNVSGTLVLGSSDGSDVLNISNITFVNGVWDTTTAQITGGAGADSGIIQVTAPNITEGGLITRFETASTASFGIIAALITTLSWDTSPVTVDRNVVFSIAMSGGLSGGTLDVQLNSSDPSDRLYDSSGLLTQITLGGGGTFSASDWYILGGNGDDNGTMTLHDPAREYEDETCPQFTIAELSPQEIEQTVSFSQVMTANGLQMQLDPDGIVTSSVLFHNGVIIRDSDGAIDTSWVGNVSITAYDNVGNILTWLGAGPDAQNYGSFIVVTVVNGQWESDDCRLLIPEASVNPALFVGQDLDSDLTGSAVSQIGTLEFDITVDTNPITRAVSFNLLIQAKDAEGNLLTTYVPVTQVDINLTSTDGSDVISPLLTDNTGWSSGAKTVSCTISGGAGSDTGSIECVDVDSAHDGETDITIYTAVPAPTIIVPTDGDAFFGVDNTFDEDAIDGTTEGDDAWRTTQNDARINFFNDTVPGGTGLAGLTKTDIHSYADFVCNEQGGWQIYNISAAQEAGAVSLLLNVTMNCVDKGNLTWPNWAWSSKAGAIFVRLIARSTLDIFSGLGLANATAFAIYSTTWGNQKSAQAGGTPAAPGTFKLQVPLSLLSHKHPSTDNLYLWVHILAPILNYDTFLWSGGSGVSDRRWETHWQTANLEIYK